MRPIEEIHAALLRIHAKACDHAAPAYMSVPANPERDADLIVSDAIAELAALRRRCDDLELIARAAIDPSGGVLPLDTPSNRWHLRAKGRRFVLYDDNTGLPILTAEARKALRGGA